jgi:hypothetical protein
MKDEELRFFSGKMKKCIFQSSLEMEGRRRRAEGGEGVKEKMKKKKKKGRRHKKKKKKKKIEITKSRVGFLEF